MQVTNSMKDSLWCWNKILSVWKTLSTMNFAQILVLFEMTFQTVFTQWRKKHTRHTMLLWFLLLLGKTESYISQNCQTSRKVYHRCCSLTEIPENIPADVEVIELIHHKLHSLNAFSFAKFLFCKELILQDGTASYIENQAFCGMKNLTILNLKSNCISSIEKLAFEGLPNLNELDLSQNKIKALHDFLHPVRHLQVLNFKTNFVHKVSATNLFRFQSLTVLDFSYNGIVSLKYNSTSIFLHLESCQILTLSNNKITKLENGIFDTMSFLEELWLSKNPLKVIEVDVFKNMLCLKYMSLSLKYLTLSILIEIILKSLAGVQRPLKVHIMDSKYGVLNCHVFPRITCEAEEPWWSLSKLGDANHYTCRKRKFHHSHVFMIEQKDQFW